MPTIQVRRGTAASWVAANTILASGEQGYETDTGNFKVGNGETAWNSLAYSTSRIGSLPSYAPSLLKNNWDPDLSGYNCNARTTRKPRARAKRVIGNSTVTHYHSLSIGDSTLVGYNGSTYQYEYCVPRQMGKSLAKFLGVEHTQGLQTAVATAMAVPDNVTLTGAWTAGSSTYPHFFTGSGVGSYTFRFLDPCTTVEFYISNQSGSGLTWSLNGGTATAISPTGAASVQKITAGSGLPKACHTITIAGATSGQFSFIMAFRGFDPLVPQLETHNLSIGGTKANDPSNANYNWSDNSTTAGGGGLGWVMNSVWTASGIGTPDSLLISAGNNDHNSSIATANIITGLTNMRNYFPNTQTMLVRPPRVNGTNATTFTALCSATFTLADTLDCLFFDWNDSAQDRTNVQADGLLGPDNNHPINGEQVGVGRICAELWNFPVGGQYEDSTNVVVLTSTSLIARWNSWYRCNAAITISLPSTPDLGTQVKVEAASTFNVTVQRLGTDTIEGATSTTVVAGDTAVYTYAAGIWYQNRSTAAATAGTDVRRNANAQLSVGTATATDHAVNKAQMDSSYKSYRTPRTTNWIGPSNLIAGVAASLTATFSGIVSFMPIEIGPNAPAFTALGVNASAAMVAGSTTTSLAVYPDGGDGAGPLCTGGPIRSGTVALTATGNRTVAIASWTPSPGLYWLTFLYVESSAPTTRASVVGINSALAGPIASTAGIGLTYSKGWQLASQTALPTTDIRTSLAPNTAAAWVVALQAA